MLFLASVLARRPLGGVLRNSTTGRSTAWRDDKRSRLYYDVATLTLAAIFAARFVAQQYFHETDTVGPLGAAKTTMSLTALSAIAHTTGTPAEAADHTAQAQRIQNETGYHRETPTRKSETNPAPPTPTPFTYRNAYAHRRISPRRRCVPFRDTPLPSMSVALSSWRELTLSYSSCASRQATRAFARVRKRDRDGPLRRPVIRLRARADRLSVLVIRSDTHRPLRPLPGAGPRESGRRGG
ncbi:DUF3159 domain-containing protein [Streptomyces purpurascens]|uniref:DUF3159 domain-containing protein n=1 Tax=Streptomyces purpurascens TaxID=1924 RepID=UPI003C2CE638